MSASHQQAEHDLKSIDESVASLRDAAIYGGAAQILLGWGVAWLLGFLGTWWMEVHQITDWRIYLMWDPLVIFGAVMTWRAMSSYPLLLNAGRRVGAMWGLIFGFLYLWLAILWQLNPHQLFTFFATIIMLAWVVLGLILNNWLWIVLGASIALLMGIGYLVIGASASLWLWHAAFAGGSMLLTAALLWHKGRSRGGA